MDLSIIIVNWNTRDMLAGCLKSIFETVDDLEFEVIVVDNASSDGSTTMVRQRFPQVRLIANDRNVGFASANNQGVRWSTGLHVLLLNPDTVSLSGALQTLVAFLQSHEDTGAIGPMILNSDGTLQSSVNPMPTLWREFWRLMRLDQFLPQSIYHEEEWGTAVAHKVEVIQGNCLLVRRKAFAQVGLLDEEYFMYTEEVDLCYRLLKAGWSLYWVPMANVVHYGGQSTRQVAREMFIELYRSKVLFFRKTRGMRGVLAYKTILILAALPRVLAGGLRPARSVPDGWRSRLYLDLLRVLPSL